MSSKPSLIIVDDNLAMAVALCDVLELKGYAVKATDSSAQALAILAEHPVDILLTDVIMPGMDGVALYLAACKTQPRLRGILMTAYSADDLIQRGKEAGVIAVLNKPLDIDLLVRILDALGTK
jgi:CheY-like chemotaxis protein